MKPDEFQEIVIRDGRIAPHATGLQPAWLWAADGAAILWTNAAGAAAFALGDRARLAEPLGAFDPYRRLVAQLSERLPKSGATRLERMHGFGATAGQFATCSCALLTLDDGSRAILIVSLAGAGKPLPLGERLQWLLDGFARQAVALSAQGAWLGTNGAAHHDVSRFEQFARSDFIAARASALRDGHAEVVLDATLLALYRVGAGHDVGILVLMPATAAHVTPEAAAPENAERHELLDQPLDESFADEVLVDEDDPLDEAAVISPGDAPAVTESLAESGAAVEPVAEAVTAPVVEPAHIAMAPPAADQVAPEIVSPKQPLRFLWQMDADTRFSLGSDEFSKLIGPMAAAALGRPWREIADHFHIDPDNKIPQAIASRETWSGIVIDWPINQSGDRIPIEMSGLPMFDRGRNFAGYRGFGICRDIAGLDHLTDMRQEESRAGTVHPAPTAAVTQDVEPIAPPIPEVPAPDGPAPAVVDAVIEEPPHETTLVEEPQIAVTIAPVEPTQSAEEPGEAAVPPQNVVPFPLTGDARTPGLSAVENHAFDEIARRLTARLDHGARDIANGGHDEPLPAEDEPLEPIIAAPDAPAAAAAPWLDRATATRGDSPHDKPLLDRVPVGVLIYRLDHLLYANAAFLERTGFTSLHALTEAGGLDALYVQPIEPSASSSSEGGMPLSIATNDTSPPALARLYSISWDGEPAMALIFSADAPVVADPAPQPVADIAPAPVPSPAQAPVNDDLGSIMEAMADGIVMFDQEGNILSCNRSAEALFNEATAQLTQRNLADLFAPESQSVVLAYFEGLDDPATRTMDHGREVLGQVRGGGLVPLAMTMGRSADDKYFAVFRDLTQLKRNEADLLTARRSAEQSASLRGDVLARINHEIRVPLNAIIGFAEAMIEQRFGPLGAERYVDYMRDIRAAGERVLAIVGDMLNLTRIETGKLDLTPTSVNLNDLVVQCVGMLQPQANRERIIIRSSLAHHLPVIFADAPSLRQIVTNLVASSIELANAGGQVIVSTALTDGGEVALRVRDTGRALSARDIKAATEPYRASAGDDNVVPDTAGINLALTKALAEANRAQLNIRNAPQAGTLIEIVFPVTAQLAAGGG